MRCRWSATFHRRSPPPGGWAKRNDRSRSAFAAFAKFAKVAQEEQSDDDGPT
jgi:hypothetical protein